MALVEASEPPLYQLIAPKAQHLRELGLEVPPENWTV